MQEENAFHHQISKLKIRKNLLKTKFETKKLKSKIRTSFGRQFYLISRYMRYSNYYCNYNGKRKIYIFLIIRLSKFSNSLSKIIISFKATDRGKKIVLKIFCFMLTRGNMFNDSYQQKYII